MFILRCCEIHCISCTLFVHNTFHIKPSYTWDVILICKSIMFHSWEYVWYLIFVMFIGKINPVSSLSLQLSIVLRFFSASFAQTFHVFLYRWLCNILHHPADVNYHWIPSPWGGYIFTVFDILRTRKVLISCGLFASILIYHSFDEVIASIYGYVLNSKLFSNKIAIYSLIVVD